MSLSAYWRTAALAVLILSGIFLGGRKLVLADHRGSDLVYVARNDASPRTGSFPLLALRDGKPPMRIGTATAEPTGVKVRIFKDEGVSPGAILIAEADLRLLWTLARESDRVAVRNEALQLVDRSAAILRNTRLPPQDSRRVDEAWRRLLGALAADRQASAAAGLLLRSLNDAVAPETTGLIGTVASNIGLNAIYGLGEMMMSLVGMEGGGTTATAFEDPVFQARIARVTRSFLSDPRSSDALMILADRAAVVIGSDPALHRELGRLLESETLRAAFARIGQESVGLPSLLLSRVLRLSAEPELNPLSAAYVSALLRRSSETVAIALTPAEAARILSTDPRLAASLHEARR